MKTHAQNNQTVAIPTKTGMQSKLNLWEASGPKWGRWGEEPNTFRPKGTSRPEEGRCDGTSGEKGSCEKRCMPAYRGCRIPGCSALRGTVGTAVIYPSQSWEPWPTAKWVSIRKLLRLFFQQWNRVKSMRYVWVYSWFSGLSTDF